MLWFIQFQSILLEWLMFIPIKLCPSRQGLAPCGQDWLIVKTKDKLHRHQGFTETKQFTEDPIWSLRDVLFNFYFEMVKPNQNQFSNSQIIKFNIGHKQNQIVMSITPKTFFLKTQLRQIKKIMTNIFLLQLSTYHLWNEDFRT